MISTILVGAAVGAGAWLLRVSDSSATSVVAIVDGTVITLRAPASGALHLETLEPGQVLPEGALIAQIEPLVEGEVTAPAPLPGLSGGFSRPVAVVPSAPTGRIRALEDKLAALRERANDLPVAAQPAQGRAPVTVPVEAPDLTGHERAIDSARAEVDAAEASLAAARKAAEKAEMLLAEGAISAKEAERARENLDAARTTHAAAQGRSERAQEALADAKRQSERPAPAPPPAVQTGSTERAAIAAEIRAIEQEIARLGELPKTVSRVARARPIFGGIGELRPITPFVPEGLTRGDPIEVRAPAEAIVWKVVARPAQRIEAQTPILRLLKADKMWVQAYFGPEPASRLRVGTQVEVRIGDRVEAGHVTEIGKPPFWGSVSAEKAPPGNLIPVKVELQRGEVAIESIGRSARVVVPG